MSQRVFLVYLRKPESKSDPRDDPFWEKGSFGITLCHHRNLLSPSNRRELLGARLAFAQPGQGCAKLVYVTPPVAVRRYRMRGYEDAIETRWQPRTMPLAFDRAPTLMDRECRTAFPALKEMLRAVKGPTPLRKLASKFRTRVEPLPHPVSAEVVDVYRRPRRKVGKLGIAKTFIEALPARIGAKYDRERRYRKLQRDAGKGSCTQKPLAWVCGSRP